MDSSQTSSEPFSQQLESWLRDDEPKTIGALTDVIDEIRAPALVLHYRGDRVIPFVGGQTLAAALPSARFIAKDGA